MSMYKMPTWPGNKEVLLAQVIRIVERVLNSDRIVFSRPLFTQDPVRRRILLTLTMTRIVTISGRQSDLTTKTLSRWSQYSTSTAPLPAPEICSPGTRVDPNDHTQRSHINVCVYDSTWESSEAYALDHTDAVQSWAKNRSPGI